MFVTRTRRRFVAAPAFLADAARGRAGSALAVYSASAQANPVASAAANAAAVPVSVLDGGELVLLAVKPSIWRALFDSGRWLFTSCLLAAVLSWTNNPLPGLSLPATAQVILLVGLARLAVAVVRWVPTWYLLTNRRVIEVQGVRAPEVRSALLVDLRQAVVQRTWIEKLCQLGTVTLITNRPKDEPHCWRSVAHAEAVCRKIQDAAAQATSLHNAAY